MGAGVIMATGKIFNVCKYKSDTPEIPTESLKPDKHWNHYGQW